MPVQSDLFHHFVVSSFFIGSNHNIEENDEIDQHTCKNVKSVKASNKEEEVGKKRTPIFISDQVGSFNNMYDLRDFVNGTLNS